MENNWIGWIVASCVVLSLYDICKKASVRGNAVFPTLLGSAFCGWLAVSIHLFATGAFAVTLRLPFRFVLLLLIKSCIVGASWTATYMALKTLPITFAAPIRATGPLWTLIGAIIFFAEVPTPVQAVGMAMVIVGCLLFSRSVVEEGFDFAHSKAVLLAFAGTVLGSVSALYDKHLLKNLGIPTSTVLWWFLGGMCMIYVAATFVWSTGRRTSPEKCSPFAWRWTIPLVGILLATSDACYFNAISVPGAKISVLSMIRRASVVLTFFLGGAVFHEVNLPRKAFALAVVLAGVLLLCLVCS